MVGSMLKRVALSLCLVMAIGSLAGCESSEERAEGYYLAGMALLEQGDADRAMVEFRNVFKYNGRHLKARMAYAQVERDRSNISSAYSQYLRVVEQYPDNFEALRALSELAVQTSNWEDARRYGKTALDLRPDDPLIRSVVAATAYQAALEAGDEPARRAVVDEARALSVELPGSLNPRRILIDAAMRDQDWMAALAEIDAAILVQPDLRDLYTLRLGVLNQLGDKVALEAQLTEMTERYADDPTVHATLVRWYLSQDKTDTAETYLRGRITQLSGDAELQVEARFVLVRFLVEVRGADAARAELDAILATNPADPAPFRSLRAGLDFEAGQREAAIAEMEDILSGASPSVQTHGIRIGLAQMLFTTGNQVGARAQVEQVLADDPTQVEALKLKAGWLIDDDRTGDAMLALRAALTQSPRDASLMSLMALAHERDGNRDLMGEMLAQAVEASNRAPEESVRYAVFLIRDEKNLAAEEVLLNALRLAPQNMDILSLLGQLYIQMSDWARSEQVVGRLRDFDTPEATLRANDLTARQLAVQDRDADLTSFLEQLSQEAGGDLSVDAALIRTYLSAGNVQAARQQSATMLAKDPADPSRRFIHASVLARSGSEAEAETIFRALLAENDQLEQVWSTLYALVLSRTGDPAATEVLQASLEALPASVQLRWIKATSLENKGDLEGAIAVYETLYADDSGSMVFANNLASLLSVARSDPESVERAYVVARRLRGATVPAYQDTYGWIQFLRGNLEEALANLEPAALGLAQDPGVQLHLGMVYARMGRVEEALAQFALVDQIAGANLPPQSLALMEAERARLAQSDTSPQPPAPPEN